MSERYLRLFSLPENLYAAGSPVIIAAGALLKDSQTARVIGQLKIRCISEKLIQAAKVRLDLFDTAGNPVGEPVRYDYLDLLASENAEFGQKTPIHIPNSNARSFKAAVTEVVFADKTVWTAGEPWEPLPVPSPLPIDDPELRRQYQLNFGRDSQYEVAEEKGLWCCTCGAWNPRGKDCHQCGNSISALQSVNLAQLNAEKDARLAQEADRAAAEKAQSSAAKKRLLIALSVCAVLLIGIAVIYSGVTSSPKYIAKQTIQEGFTYYTSGAFSEAERTWKAVDMQFVEKNTLNEPVQASGQIGYAPTSEELLAHGEPLFYEYACYLAHRSFHEAIPYFQQLSGYEDSSAMASTMQTLLDRYVGEYQCISSWEQYNGSYGLGDKKDKGLYDNFSVYGMHYKGKGMSDIQVDYNFRGTRLSSYRYRGEEMSLYESDHPWTYDYTFSEDGTTFTAVTRFDGGRSGELIYTAIWKKIPS